MPLNEMEKIVQEEIEKVCVIKSKFVVELRKKFKLAEYCNINDCKESSNKIPLNLTKKQKKQLKKKQKKKEKKNKKINDGNKDNNKSKDCTV